MQTEHRPSLRKSGRVLGLFYELPLFGRDSCYSGKSSFARFASYVPFIKQRLNQLDQNLSFLWFDIDNNINIFLHVSADVTY